MGFSAFWFSHHCHLNHEEFQKCFFKLYKTFKEPIMHKDLSDALTVLKQLYMNKLL